MIDMQPKHSRQHKPNDILLLTGSRKHEKVWHVGMWVGDQSVLERVCAAKTRPGLISHLIPALEMSRVMSKGAPVRGRRAPWPGTTRQLLT